MNDPVKRRAVDPNSQPGNPAPRDPEQDRTDALNKQFGSTGKYTQHDQLPPKAIQNAERLFGAHKD